MATTNDAASTMAEPCPDCGRETPHEVSVQILTESTKPDNAEFSREPYRVSKCRVCGTTTTTRMNNA
ncbi:MAG: rRNA maturation protein Nop10 [Natronomonas sp.]|jgi:rRNA maturation protein Nop10